jgi:L-asparaginase II
MLLACRRLALDPAGYIDVQHPLQQRIATEIGAAVGLAGAANACGIDGCSAPTFALPLSVLARGFATLAGPDVARLETPRADALGRLCRAMAANPEMVAGPGRFTTALTAATGGRVVGKEGAEGVYALAVRAPRPFGIALKIADGAERCRDLIVLELLTRLEVLSADERLALADFDQQVVRNHRGVVVGRVVADFTLD